MTREEFAALAAHPVILDGGTGSNLYKAGMPRGVCTEKWLMENPEPEEKLIRAYVEAGSMMVLAPTFGANPNALKGHGLAAQTDEMNHRLVELARRGVASAFEKDDPAAKSILVAGDLSPTGMILEDIGGDNTEDEIREVYHEQLVSLIDAGVDLISFETMMSADEAAIGIDEARQLCDLPITCSFSISAGGRLYFGGTIYEAVEGMNELGISAVGLNCGSGPIGLESTVRRICELTDLPVICKPNAGMPSIDDQGNAIYDMGPAEFVIGMKEILASGARLVGGCCGTDPEYIRRLSNLVKGVPVIG